MTDRRQAGAVIILRETARGARKALEVPEKGENYRTFAKNDGFGMLIRVHQVYMPGFSSLLTFLAGAGHGRRRAARKLTLRIFHPVRLACKYRSDSGGMLSSISPLCGCEAGQGCSVSM